MAPSAYHMLTGHIHFTPGTLRHPTPNDFPHVGCAVARFARQPAHMPPYVALPSIVYDGDGGEVPGQGPGLLGQRRDRFLVNGDPTRPDFSIDTLTLPEEITSGRLRQRIGLQAALDGQAEQIVRLPGAQNMAGHYDRAFTLLQSPEARRAFDLAAEPARSRDAYGWHHFGQSCLLARRLLEADVPMVTVYWNAPTNTDDQSWDTHNRATERMGDHLLPAFDLAMTALLEDLHSARSLLADTLVMWMGEFGRTPRVNRLGAAITRASCQSVLLAEAAGVRGGQVYGSSDAQALPTPPSFRSAPTTSPRPCWTRWAFHFTRNCATLRAVPCRSAPDNLFAVCFDRLFRLDAGCSAMRAPECKAGSRGSVGDEDGMFRSDSDDCNGELDIETA